MSDKDEESTREYRHNGNSGEIDTLDTHSLVRVIARDQRVMQKDMRQFFSMQIKMNERLVSGDGRMALTDADVLRCKSDIQEIKRRCEARACVTPVISPAPISETEDAGKTINVKALVLTITAIGGFIVSILTAVAVFFGHKGAP